MNKLKERQKNQIPRISIIAAHDKNRGIGYKNKLPWHIKEDLLHFKSLTTYHPVIMGRKTFESIKKPLADRANIVITRDRSYRHEGIVVVHSLKKAIDTAKKNKSNEIFIIGGESVFKQALKHADRLYITIIHHSFICDAFFPDYSKFSRVISRRDSCNNLYSYTFYILEKP